MRVRKANALRVEGVRFNHVPHFIELRYSHFKQRIHVVKSLSPVAKRTKGNLGNYEGMHDNLPPDQAFLHLRVAVSQMVNPDRCVGQDHRLSAFTRLISSKSGSVPPTAASLREASR